MDKAGRKGQLRLLMGNEKQDRVSDQGFTPGSPVKVPDFYAGSYAMSLTLLHGENNPLESDSSWDTPSPEIWLLRDLLKESGGAPGALKKGTFQASFPNLLSVILCARRIQWALHGLAQHQNWAGTQATILIHSGKAQSGQLPTQTVIPGNEMRGKILIEKGVSGYLEGLSAVLASRTCEPFLEVLWGDHLTDLEPEFFKSALRIPEQNEGNSGSVSPADNLVLPLEPIASHEMPPSLSTYDGPFGAEEEPGRWKAFTGRGWLIAAGSGMLAILLIILFVAHAHKSGQSASSGQVDSSGQTASSAQVASQPSPAVSEPPTPVPTPPATVKSSEVPQPSTKVPKHEPKSPKPPKSEESSVNAAKGSCDLSDAEIERSLKRADNNLHAGKFSEALQAYRQVVDCPAARERAQQGINSTRLKMSLAGQSDTND